MGCRRAATTKMAVFPSYLLCRVGIFFSRCELFTPRGKPLKRLPFSCDRRGHPLRVSCANRRGGARSFWGAHGVLAGTGAHPRAVWQAEGRSWGVSTKARCRRPLSSPHPESGPREVGPSPRGGQRTLSVLRRTLRSGCPLRGRLVILGCASAQGRLYRCSMTPRGWESPRGASPLRTISAPFCAW